MRRYLNFAGTKGRVGALVFVCFVGLSAVLILWRWQTKQIERELAEIAAPSGARVTQHNVANKISQGVIGNYYHADLTYDQIRAHYDAELVRQGWKFKEATPLTNWGNDLGESHTVYCRGNHAAGIYFTGKRQKELGYRYGLDISWGLDYCP